MRQYLRELDSEANNGAFQCLLCWLLQLLLSQGSAGAALLAFHILHSAPQPESEPRGFGMDGSCGVSCSLFGTLPGPSLECANTLAARAKTVFITYLLAAATVAVSNQSQL